MKKAFTLVELLVVVGIIAILIAVLSVNLLAGGETARAARCLTNMKNLASSVSSYVMATGYYPCSGSVEGYNMTMTSGGGRRAGKTYYEVHGWISWYSNGAYESKPSAHISSGSWFSSAYTDNQDEREYCLTNGALWRYVGGNRDVFTCPKHIRDCKNVRPAWSYVMNGWFTHDKSEGGKGYPDIYGNAAASVDRLERRLLFAELQWTSALGSTPNLSKSAGTHNDCTLQFDKHECIGFNHKDGKEWVAHVVFADGHVEKLRQPRTGFSETMIQELTEMLCKAKDISFNGQQYEEMK